VQHFGKAYGGNPPANYERFFVPAIGGPLATDLIRQQVGATETVAGLDVNPGMLAVARSATPTGMPIEWHEASAEAMPLPDASFDVVLCQMGL
jgi:ubiquinone/menaquinone biosynthesis C-methylase UbiE